MNIHKKLFFLIFISCASGTLYASQKTLNLFRKKSSKIIPTNGLELQIDVNPIPEDATTMQTPPPPSKPKQTLKKTISKMRTINAFTQDYISDTSGQETKHPSSPQLWQQRSGSLTSTDRSLSFSYDTDHEDDGQYFQELTEKIIAKETVVVTHLQQLQQLETTRKLCLVRYSLAHPKDLIIDQHTINKKAITDILEQI